MGFAELRDGSALVVGYCIYLLTKVHRLSVAVVRQGVLALWGFDGNALASFGRWGLEAVVEI